MFPFYNWIFFEENTCQDYNECWTWAAWDENRKMLIWKLILQNSLLQPNHQSLQSRHWRFNKRWTGYCRLYVIWILNFHSQNSWTISTSFHFQSQLSIIKANSSPERWKCAIDFLMCEVRSQGNYMLVSNSVENVESSRESIIWARAEKCIGNVQLKLWWTIKFPSVNIYVGRRAQKRLWLSRKLQYLKCIQSSK